MHNAYSTADHTETLSKHKGLNMWRNVNLNRLHKQQSRFCNVSHSLTWLTETKVNEPNCTYTVPHIDTAELLGANTLLLWLSSSISRKIKLHLVYRVREVVAIHLVAVGLTSWTLNLDAVTLQDGCFFKNTNLIIAYRPQSTPHSDASKWWCKEWRSSEAASC